MRFLVLVSAAAMGGACLSFTTRAPAANPSAGECISAADQALVARRAHRLRAARAQLLVCATTTCPGDVRNECVRRLAEVTAATPTIVFETKDAAGDDVAGVKVTMDGEDLTPDAEGMALAVDPGDRSFSFEAAGRPTVQKSFVIREAEKERRERIVFPGALAPAPLPQPMPTTPPEEAGRGLGAQRVLAILSAGVGVIGLGVGTVFGLQAISKKSQASDACPGSCQDAHGADLWKSAGTAADLSTVAFAVGGAGVAGGALLWFTAPSRGADTSKTQIGLGPQTLQVKVTWR